MDKGNPWESVTVKMWFGGSFTRHEMGLGYNGKMFRTTDVEIDEFCWFTILEKAEECGLFYRKKDAIFYMDPNLGLQRIVDDVGAKVMCKIALESRIVECYLVSGGDVAHLMHLIEVSKSEVNGVSIVKCSKKLTPRRKEESISNSAKEGPLPKSTQRKVVNDSHTAIKKKEKKTTPIETASESKSIPKKPTPDKESTFKESSLKQTVTKSQTSTVIEATSEIQPILEATSIQPTLEPNVNQLYDFNDITISNFFNEYEKASDLACLNVDAELENEDLSDGADPGYEPDLEECETDCESEGSDVEIDDGVSEGEGSDVEIDEGVTEVEQNLTEPQWGSDGCSEDEETIESRRKVKEWNSKTLAFAKKLEVQASNVLLPGQETVECSGAKENEGGVGDYGNSADEVDTPAESGEESIPGKKRRSRVPVVNENSDFSKFKWCVGIEFPTREIFRECVKRYAVAQGRDLTFVVSDQSRGRRLGVKCKVGCPFKLYGSWDNKSASFLVKTVNPSHNCHRTMESNRQLKSSWVAKQFLEVFKAKPHLPAAEIIDTVRRAYKVIIKKGFAYKTKYYAHKLLHGSMREHYSKLGSYMAALKQEYPTSVFTLATIPSNVSSVPVFQRLFVCFDALRQGWLSGCRKLLCVDACFLKTFLGGQLISAIGRDGNDQMYPLAWAVVEGENNESYEWFFKELKKATMEEDGEGWTIISDEHQSIISMVAKEFPKAEHRKCGRHIFANWHKHYKGEEMKMLFWNCAQSYNQADFNDAIAALKEVDPRASDAFLGCNPTFFCRAFINTATVNNVIVNNMAETFNAYIINARSMHLIYMLEEIRTMLMQRLATKKRQMEESDAILCPNIQEILEKEKEKASYCTVMPSSPTQYQVKDGIDEVKVNLAERTCTCRKWDVTGIPCRHAIAAIFDIHAPAEDYVHPMYTRQIYLQAYHFSIGPLPGERHWPKVDLPMVPPPIKVGPGRPRKKRRRDPHEDPKKKGKLTKHGLEMSCTICKSKEHNKRRCPQKDKVLPPPLKRQRGRPKAVNVGEGQEEGSCSQSHHGATAIPTRLGRGGRVITTARGVRGGSTGARGSRRGARGGGRGQRAPQGIGVLIDGQGNAFTNAPGSTSGPRSIMAAA